MQREMDGAAAIAKGNHTTIAAEVLSPAKQGEVMRH
jgi:hypothetical protein